MIPLEILSLATLSFWILLALDRSRAWPTELRLTEEASLPPDGPAALPPSVVAVVPARDEASVLPETLPALLAQEDPELRVVLVDDASSDDTASVAQEVAQAAGLEDRLRVITAETTPAGWTGKVHALACGVAAARQAFPEGEGPDWILFTDADILHRPGSVRALLARALGTEGYDLVSVMARLQAETFWERLLVPPFVFFFQLLYPFRRVKRPGSRVAAAAGGCVLLRRSTLEAAGGLESIRGEVIDDVALAKRVKAISGRLWLGFDAGIRSRRSYRSLGGLWNMVARTAFVQLRHRLALLLLVLVALALFLAAPALVALAAGSWLGLGGGGGAEPSLVRAVVWSLLAWVLSARAILPAVRHHRVPGAYAWTLPFAAILYGAMTLSSAWRHLAGRATRWKGRSYGAAAR